jgi:hypothetical protein
MDIDSFRANLTGGGARSNLFRVVGGFPSGATALIGAAAGLASAVGAISSNAANAATSVANALGAGGPGRQLSFLCKSASMPESTLGTIRVPFRGRELKLPGDRTYSSWQISIINDTSFQLRDAFMKWSNSMNDPVANVGIPGLNTAQDWEVQQLDRQGGNVIKTYKLIGAWPQSVGAISLDYNSTDQIEEYQVTLEYQYFIDESLSNTATTLNAISGTL